MIKLTNKQRSELIKNKYIPTPERRLCLYKGDFNNAETWEEICKAVGINNNNIKVTLSYIAYNT